MEKLQKFAEAKIPTDWGTFLMSAFAVSESELMPHILIKHPEIDINNPVTIRIHSECLTGDLFHSNKCDCGEQLSQSMKIIEKEKGALLYLRQEGRGIGIINKLKAYNKQEEGLDTIEANVVLGFGIDERKFEIAIQILKLENIKSIHLLTNNPEKIKAIEESDINLVKRIPLEIAPNDTNKGYLNTKKNSLGHLLEY